MKVSEATPAMVPFLPETAPFSTEQRAWLNGFFAGLLAPEPGGSQGPAEAQNEEEEVTWHDPTLAINERMKLAEGKPVRLKMMAAMAQQDCGQCGYICETYADAIASGAEERLNLCAPGKKETARVLKTLFAEMKVSPSAASPAILTETAPVGVHSGPQQAFSRANPAVAIFDFRRRLNKEDSEKSTYHIEFDLAGSELTYNVGDSFGVFPQNDPALVDAVIEAIHADADAPVGETSLRDALLNRLALGAAPDALFELISHMTGGERRKKAKLLAQGDDPDGDAATLDVLAALEKFPGLRPDPEAFAEALEPLQPRLYSISSSPKLNPDRLCLTVDHVRYLIHERVRRGVASSWLCERLEQHTRLKSFIQPAHDFALPPGDVPIIMVGPGTGVAPFRAFLQERLATQATAGAWLFFGHQRRAADFFYEDEFTGLMDKNILTKLSLAWSRDQDKKVYVQDKMREEAKDIWDWLEKGAHFYICGDAKRMAADVEKALIDIIAEQGGRGLPEAKAFIQNLRKAGRYQTDVY